MKSKTRTDISIYWNNKDNLNFVEVTPNKHNWLIVQKEKPLFFEFHAEDSDSKKDRGKIVIYINTNV